MLIGGVGLTVRTVPRVRRCLTDESVYADATHGSVGLSLGPTQKHIMEPLGVILSSIRLWASAGSTIVPG